MGVFDLPSSGEPIYVRVGRYGPFLQQGERRASIPEGTPPDELTIEVAMGMLDQSTQADEPLGICPETRKPVFLKIGRFGPYVQRGTADDEEKPKNASLLKGMQPGDVDLATALALLSLPRDLGPHPEGPSPLSGKPVVAHNGRFGPYVKCGDETRSLPGDVSPLSVTLAQAVELLSQPKQMRRGFGAARTPLKTFPESPQTKQPIQLFEGRYGPYVTDGTTNASVPKTTPLEELSFEQAVQLLAERAAMGPSKKARRGGKGGARWAPAKKKAAPKRAAKKKPPAKKAGKRKKKTEN